MRILGAITICFVSFVAFCDDQLDHLLSQQKAARAELIHAQSAFRKQLPSIPEYKQAADNLNECQAEVERLRQGHDDAAFAEASKKKRAAESELRKVTEELMAKNPEVSKAKEQANSIQTQIDAAEHAQAVADWAERQKQDAEIAKHKQEAEAQRAAYAQKYGEIINIDYSHQPVPHASIPLKGDEIGLSEPKADPQKFVNHPFVVCCAVKVTDYFNWGYDNAKQSHYALHIEGLTADKNINGRATAYIEKEKGKGLIELLTAREKYWPQSPWVMRLKLYVDPNYTRTFDDAHEMYTLEDWQILGANDWTPWYSQVVGEK